MKGCLGSFSSGITGTLLFPLENIKIRLQLSDKSSSQNKQVSFLKEISTMTEEIYSKEGLVGFYSGLSQYLTYNMTQWGVFFLLKEFFAKEFKKRKIIKNEILREIVINYLAGVCNVFVTCPLSVIFNYVVSQRKKSGISLSMVQACHEIHMKNGFAGFYRGLSAALILVLNPTLNLSIFKLINNMTKSNQ
jgi:hypothetical protein